MPNTTAPSRARNVVLIFAITLAIITYVDRICMSQAKLTIQGEFGLSDKQVGWLFSIFTLAYGIFEIPFGWLGDKYGPRIMLLRVVAMWSIFTSATGAAWNYFSLMLSRFMFGVGEAGCFPNISKVFTIWIPSRERVRAQGMLWMSARWGGAFAPFLVVSIAAHTNWRTPFFVFGIAGVIWAVCFAMWFRDDPRKHPSVNDAERAMLDGAEHNMASRESHIPWARFFRSPTVWLLWLQYFCMNYGWYFYITWLPTYLKEVRGVSVKESAFLAALDPFLALFGNEKVVQDLKLAVLAGIPLLFGGLGSLFCGSLGVVEQLQKKHQIAYWFRIEEEVPLDHSKFPGTIFHEYHAALANIPPEGTDLSMYPPWSAQEIQSYAACETEIMTMIDKWHPAWPVNQRKDFYYEMLRMWGALLDELKPEAIVYRSVPHEMGTFVLYEIAKRRGIKTIMLDIVLNQDRLIAFDNFRTGNRQLASGAASGFRGGSASLSDLSPYMRTYYETMSNAKNPEPLYLVDFKKTHTTVRWYVRRARALAPYVRDASIFERAITRVFKTIKSDSRDEYRSLQQTPDYTKPYIYVPIHFQPECTTSPQGGVYVDQILMIKTLAAALPEGWGIYIKEHPAQWTAHGNDFTPQRYPGYYRELASLSGVRLVPVETNTFELADHAKATATVTGMAGWESVCRGKPALMFGYPWFMHAPGVFLVRGFEDCKKAIKEVQKGAAFSKEEFIAYLRALEQVICKGFLSTAGKAVAQYSEDEHVADVTRAIEVELSRSV